MTTENNIIAGDARYKEAEMKPENQQKHFCCPSFEDSDLRRLMTVVKGHLPLIGSLAEIHSMTDLCVTLI